MKSVRLAVRNGEGEGRGTVGGEAEDDDCEEELEAAEEEHVVEHVGGCGDGGDGVEMEGSGSG